MNKITAAGITTLIITTSAIAGAYAHGENHNERESESNTRVEREAAQQEIHTPDSEAQSLAAEIRRWGKPNREQRPAHKEDVITTLEVIDRQFKEAEPQFKRVIPTNPWIEVFTYRGISTYSFPFEENGKFNCATYEDEEGTLMGPINTRQRATIDILRIRHAYERKEFVGFSVKGMHPNTHCYRMGGRLVLDSEE